MFSSFETIYCFHCSNFDWLWCDSLAWISAKKKKNIFRHISRSLAERPDNAFLWGTKFDEINPGRLYRWWIWKQHLWVMPWTQLVKHNARALSELVNVIVLPAILSGTQSLILPGVPRTTSTTKIISRCQHSRAKRLQAFFCLDKYFMIN